MDNNESKTNESNNNEIKSDTIYDNESKTNETKSDIIYDKEIKIKKIKKRNIIISVLLSIVTVFIYLIYWTYKVTKEMYEIAGIKDKNAKIDMLLIVVTLGLWIIYLSYKLGKISNEIRAKYGLVPKDNTTIYVVLSIFGLTIVNMAILQSILNEEFIDAFENSEMQLKVQ
jgi:hypothetical protein